MINNIFAFFFAVKENEETPADPKAHATDEESPCEYRSESHASSVIDHDTSSWSHWVPVKSFLNAFISCK